MTGFLQLLRRTALMSCIVVLGLCVRVLCACALCVRRACGLALSDGRSVVSGIRASQVDVEAGQPQDRAAWGGIHGSWSEQRRNRMLVRD